VSIGVLGEDRCVRVPHRLVSLVPFAVDVVAARGLEYPIGRHHRHQRVNIMTIPGVGECRQELFQVPIR
jgi:hypothetical protein